MSTVLYPTPQAEFTPLTLPEAPDWHYLLSDFYELYRHLPAGGSTAIRGHQRQVRERIRKVMTSKAVVHRAEPVLKPAVRHLRRAFDLGKETQHAHFIRALEAVAEQLVWEYGYEKVPRGLSQKYAYAELAGPNGPVLTDQVILGLVLFAPGCVYPAHAHDGISESYICLSGAVSENDQGVYAPGSLIYNPPGRVHRITTAQNTPSLLCYAWTGDPEKLAHQKMTFTRPRTVK
ncbi:dimethylsulfonioproprionate lyase family protein [Pseudaestuariivita sp.]|uniref:dimethylsulfonioproprionate lyase family protein n=1 Tax=Pseudaestuariivita sp. TaxID=2211669 RepID=UPI004058D395